MGASSEASPDRDRPPGIQDREVFNSHYSELAPAMLVWIKLRFLAPLQGFCQAEDLLQEVWCRAYEFRDRYDPSHSTFRAWLFVVAKNVLLETLRKASRVRRLGEDDGRTTRFLRLGKLPDEATSITRRLTRDEGLQRFFEWIDALDEEERDLVIHCGIEGLGYAEAAERFATSKEAVKKRWQRLRARLEALGYADVLVVMD